jgi:hypothetical protein
MAVTVFGADSYIEANCIDIDDWTDADEAKKQRIVNVAARTLSTRFPSYTIPDTAAYEFANVLATVFNDTNKMAQQGVASFYIDGVGSFNFKDSKINGPGADLSKFIPQSSLDIISAANDSVNLSARRVGYMVM